MEDKLIEAISGANLTRLMKPKLKGETLVNRVAAEITPGFNERRITWIRSDCPIISAEDNEVTDEKIRM